MIREGDKDPDKGKKLAIDTDLCRQVYLHAFHVGTSNIYETEPLSSAARLL